MDFIEYKWIINQLRVGKYLPDAIYLHESALHVLPQTFLAYITEISNKVEFKKVPWNIVKLFRHSFKLSLLNYPTFFEDSYPPLHSSHLFDLAKGTIRTTNYENSDNPPILHRKETFLESNHPSVPLFRSITKEGEEAGLYENVKVIGFKRSWEKLIADKGYILIQGRLRKDYDVSTKVQNNRNVSPIARHKTAIDRNNLSAPMQTLFRHNYFNRKYSILDYGCGKGDDIRILAEHGINATGWDPVYFPEKKPIGADIVNLGYVINVIEDQWERRETLKMAHKFSNKILVVSAMLGGQSIISQFKSHGDGVRTSRNTFQKYYSQSELRTYLEESLGELAIAVAPGIFYIFKDKIEEQNFLINREKVKRKWERLSYKGHSDRLYVKQRNLIESHKKVFDDFWTRCIYLGRLPANQEFEQTNILRELCGSHQRGLEILLNFYGKEIYRNAEIARRDDLLVYFALGLFDRRRPYVKMPFNIKRDIKEFFGNYSQGLAQAKDLLFSVGKPDIIQKACEDFYKSVKKGRMQDDHSLTIHRDFLGELPPVLRVYVGCATQLYGDVENIDLVKIHIRSGKVSLMRYDNFEGKPLPLLLERIKIKLREQEIDIFKYEGVYQPRPLYFKSQYISNENKYYKRQCHFDKRLNSVLQITSNDYGPSFEELLEIISNNDSIELEEIFSYKTE